MVNQIVLVGRIAKAPETKVTENGKKYATITLAVPRMLMVNMIQIF